MTELPELFAQPQTKQKQEHQQTEERLSAKIGQLEMELDWWKKKVGLFPGESDGSW